jgi:hypothetical protein
VTPDILTDMDGIQSQINQQKNMLLKNNTLE